MQSEDCLDGSASDPDLVQIQRLKDPADEEGDESDSEAMYESDSRPPEHIKTAFASLADAYRTVDEEDSHQEPTSARGPPRSSIASSKSRSPLKPTKTPGSPNNREKRELEPVSPRPAKARKSEVAVAEIGSASGPVDPSELSLRERKALFEKQTQTWKSNDVSRKIEQQKEEDMKVVKKRGELMVEEERRAAGRQHEVEELLEQRKKHATYNVSLPDRPPPLPLPESSVHQETALHTSTPVFDAIARFENSQLANQKTKSPSPPPPFLGVNNAQVIVSNGGLVMDRPRVALPEEDEILSNSDSSDQHAAEDEQCAMSEAARLDTTVNHQKPLINPKSRSGGRVVSSSSDNSDEEANTCARSPQRKRSGSSSLKPKAAEPKRSCTAEHNEPSDRAQISSLDTTPGSSAVPQPISLSFYRKSQRKAETAAKWEVIFEEGKREVTATEDDSQRQLVLTSYQQKLDALHEVSRQQYAVLIQTTSALNLCRTAPEFQDSIERAECERLLLLAAEKRDACHLEINRLNSAVIQVQQGGPIPDQGCRGTVTISAIQLSTKAGLAEFFLSEVEHVQYFVVLMKHREKVYATQMVNFVQHLQKDGTFTIPNAVTFDDLEDDFVINIEIYAVQARRETVSHEEKYHITDSGKKTAKGHTLKRLLPALKDSSTSHTAAVGTLSKQEIRTSSFVCVGSCRISLQNVREEHFRLSKVPEHCALKETLRLQMTCGVSLENTAEGFLTIFEDSCGPSSWHRLWCVLKNDSILMWKYPEDKATNVKPKVLSLRTCLGGTETPSFSVCPRPHTFQMMLSRPLKLSGLEPEESGPYRYFLSADGKEERFVWQEKLNKVLGHIRTWIPNEEPDV